MVSGMKAKDMAVSSKLADRNSADRNEGDVVAVRQRARRIAELLGFERQDQTRIATAVSEMARNAFGYAGGGRAEFVLDASCRPAAIRGPHRDKGRASRTCRSSSTADTVRRAAWVWASSARAG